jgi:GNAT superfamily N-acetyltransferase
VIRAVAYEDALHLADAMSEEMKVLYDSTEGATPVSPGTFEPPGVFLVLDDVACGGLAVIDEGIGEVKRMYVVPSHRGQGHSRTVLRALVQHARDVGLREVWLETGAPQVAAVKLYESEGFQPIPPYGYWKDHPETLCFKVVL